MNLEQYYSFKVAILPFFIVYLRCTGTDEEGI